MSSEQIWQLAEAAVAGTLSPQEVAELKTRQIQDPEFAQSFQESCNLVNSLTDRSKHQQFKSLVADIHAQESQKSRFSKIIVFKSSWFRTAAVAAGIALLTSLTTVWTMRHSDPKGTVSSPNIQLLVHEINRIKQSQNEQQRQIADIKDQQNSSATEPASYNGSGTGFALTNDGYFVTSYHVAEGSDSVYILTRNGIAHKASMVAFDSSADVAVLKVDDDNFKCAKTEVPYTFAAGKVALGSRIYTLGFPQDEIVYNEGYISGRNGYNGDSLQYRLEIAAGPGQSGEPVMSESGNVIGLVKSKDLQAEGTTYAISSKALNHLLRESGVHLPKINRLGRMNREQQIEKLQDYTCMVQVYKSK